VYWSRELQALGHKVRLMPPAYVKPYFNRRQRFEKRHIMNRPQTCKMGAFAGIAALAVVQDTSMSQTTESHASTDYPDEFGIESGRIWHRA